MALIFNPPPNWPAPPSKDWRPAPGWQPDPAWGPAPEGWNFWVEDTAFAPAVGVPGAPAQPAPEAQPAAPVQPEPVDAEQANAHQPPVEAPAQENAPQPTVEAPAQENAPTQAEPTVPLADVHASEAQTPETPVAEAPAAEAAPAGAEDATRVLPAGPAESPAQHNAAEAGTAPVAGAQQAAPSPYQQATPYAAMPQASAPQPGQPGSPYGAPQNQAAPQGSPYPQYPQAGAPYQQPNPYGAPQGQQANPYSQTAAATAAANGSGKKNFFATGAGIVTIIGALLVVLIIALVSTLIIGGGSKETSSSSDSYYSSSDESSASSDESASESDDSETVEEYGVTYGKDVQVTDEDGSKVYTGNGNQIFTIEKPEGLESVAWLEYDFKGEDEYSYISFRTLSANDDLTGSIIDSTFEQNSTGSYWLDARTIYDDKYTEKLKVEAEGDWTIKVHPLSKAPVKKIGDSISGNAAAAFVYEPDAASNVKATFKAADEYGGDLQMTTQAEDLAPASKTLINTDQDDFEGSASMPEGKQYVSVSAYSGTWELTFEGK